MPDAASQASFPMRTTRLDVVGQRWGATIIRGSWRDALYSPLIALDWMSHEEDYPVSLAMCRLGQVAHFINSTLFTPEAISRAMETHVLKGAIQAMRLAMT